MLRTACRHQDSQESSGDDKMAPYRVRARAPPHRTSTPLDRSETYTPPTRPTHPSSTWRTSHVPWPGSSVRGPPQKRRPRVPRPPYRRPLSSPPRRMARSADLGLSSPEAVVATSPSHSGPSAAMSPRTSSAASPKFTPAALAEGRRCRGAGSSGSGGAESGRLLLAARFLAAAAGLLERAAAAGGSSS